MATGWAIGRDEPALVLLHTTAGLGNAVGALATARVNRAPLVVLVGQQDRRHLAHEPFLAGRLEGLAGTYPVSVEQPVRPQELPGAIDRAWHAATTRRGPALVVVPMDDWLAPAADEGDQPAAAGTVLRAAAADPAAVDALVALLDAAERPAARRRRRGGRAAGLGRARRARGAARRAGLAGGVRRPGRVPAGPPAFRGPPAVRPGQAPRRPRAVRRCPRGRRAGVPPVRVRAGAVPRPGHTGRGGHRRPRRGAPQRRGAGRARPRRPDVRGARRPSRRARGRTSSGARVRAAARPGRDGRPAHVRPRLLGARAAPAARGDRVRGGALQQARAPRADRGARAARVPEPGDGRARVRDPGLDRRPDGPPRTVPWSRSSATGRPSTRSRRSGARRTTGWGWSS